MHRIALGALLCLVLAACGSGGGSSLPHISSGSDASGGSRAESVRSRPAAAGTGIAIDLGGPAVGSFVADVDGTGGFVSAGTTAAIDTSHVTNPAPQQVYQTARDGNFSYTIPGLTQFGAYTVRLHFAETLMTAAGQRVFSASINGTQVLTNFDIFAAAGGKNIAVIQPFAVNATSSGTISLQFSATVNRSLVSGIEIIPVAGSTPSPVADGIAINAGGYSAGSFVSDVDFSGGYVSAGTSAAINTSTVVNPAPQNVYQTGRDGNFSYTIPGLTPGAPYTVRLHFAETYWGAAGKRTFNVSINSLAVLTAFDIFSAAGGKNIAIVKPFNATAAADGTITVSFASIVDRSLVAGIEIIAGAAAVTPLNDYPTYGYDNARDGFNPNTKTITPASLSQLHLAWQTTVNQQSQISGSQSQPILATNLAGHAGILVVGGVNGDYYGFDALSGAAVWSTPTHGNETYTCSYATGQFNVGVGGTAAYDPGSKSFYITGNANSAPNAAAQNTLYRFDAATGTLLGSVALTSNLLPNELDFAHTAVTIGPSGMVYAGIGSTCDVPNSRGQVVAVNPASMSVAQTFFTTWNQGGPYLGGGVWGWGGVSIDAGGNVYATTGNTYDSRNVASITAPGASAPGEASGLGENIIELSPTLGLEASDSPGFPVGSGGADDLDFSGSPILFTPLGCDQLTAAQGKAGQLLTFDTTAIASGPSTRYQLSKAFYSAAYLGNPTYSPLTGLVYANTASSQGGSIRPPGLIAMQPSGCSGSTILWNAAFGPDSFAYSPASSRGTPTVTAGGVLLASSPCTPNGSGGCGAASGTPSGAVWALDASSGQVLNGGNPLLITPGQIRMPPVVDGDWVYVYDNNGDLYGLTIDAVTTPSATRAHKPVVARNFAVPSR